MYNVRRMMSMMCMVSMMFDEYDMDGEYDVW